MPEVVSVGANGAVHGEALDKSIVTGSGMFVSVKIPKVGQVWKAALIPKTMQMNNPKPNTVHRIIDVPVKDEKGNVVMIEDPAAKAAIAEHWKGKDEKHDWMPIMQFPERGENIGGTVAELKDIIAEQSRVMAQAMENQTKLLAAVLAGKAPEAVAPKRRGRPPKALKEG